jgi:hypothetical protein
VAERRRGVRRFALLSPSSLLLRRFSRDDIVTLRCEDCTILVKKLKAERNARIEELESEIETLKSHYNGMKKHFLSPLIR